ncbi:hypothetical protein DL96DRAFT_1596088 [Flagelloscypha sp. PMI_526]|nr:hypothetical protein DL96DRAFT_1596088 [Flagelloscypha sp. PMI_526]
MEEPARGRAQSVLSFRNSGIQSRASKWFSKLKIQSSKTKTDSKSPYLSGTPGTPGRTRDSRRRESMKPYMSQPVLGLNLNEPDEDDLHSPESNSGASSGDDPSPMGRRISHDQGRMSLDAPHSALPALSLKKEALDSLHHPMGTLLASNPLAPTVPSNITSSDAKFSTVDGLPSVFTIELSAASDGFPDAANSLRNATQEVVAPPVPESITLHPDKTSSSSPSAPPSSSLARPRIPTRPPPPVPPDSSDAVVSSSTLRPPSIVLSPPTNDSRASKTFSVYSAYSDITEGGYETAPSSPTSSDDEDDTEDLESPSTPPASTPFAMSTQIPAPLVLSETPAKAEDSPPDTPTTPTAATPEAATPVLPILPDTPISEEPQETNEEDVQRIEKTTNIPPPSPSVPRNSFSSTSSSRRSPAPRFTAPLPAHSPLPLPPLRTSTLGATPGPSSSMDHQTPSSPFRTSPGGAENLHRRFSTQPGTRGSVIFTESGETARFSPSIVTYQRLPPGAMRISFPDTGGVDEEGRRIEAPRTPTVSQSLRGVGGTNATNKDNPNSKAKLLEMPAMSVGGEMDMGDDGDHDSSDEAESDNDDDTSINVANDDDDDETNEGISLNDTAAPASSPTSPRAVKRFFSFSSSSKDKAATSPSPPPTIKAKSSIINGLPSIPTSPLDTSVLEGLPDIKGKGKEKATTISSGHTTPTGDVKRHSSVRVSSAAGTDYFSSKTPVATPSTSVIRNPWDKLTPGGLSVRTPSGGYAKPEDVPPVPQLPNTIRMPPVPVQSEDGRPTIYKQASRSMIDLHAMVKFEAPSTTPPLHEVETPEDDGSAAPLPRTKKISSAPAYEPPLQRAQSGIRRQRSMPTFNPATEPPPYPSFSVGPFGPSGANILIMPREDEGREELPSYSNDIYIKAIMPLKMEFSAPGVQAKDRKWRRVLCVLEGTALKIYHCRAGRQVPGGVSAFSGWWERKVGAADVSIGNVTTTATAARIGREKERERQRQLEAVRKLEGEANPRIGGAGQTDIILPEAGPSFSPPPAPSGFLSRLKPHSRSRSEALSNISPSQSRASFSSARPHRSSQASSIGSPVRPSLDVPSQSSGGSHRNSVSVSPTLSRTSSNSSSALAPSSSIQQNLKPSNSSQMNISGTLNDYIPDPEPSDLIRAYTLQHAESGLGNDYVKRRNVIRIRMEGEQFLVQATHVSEVVEWIEGLHAAANIALDLDERPMPKGPLFPRRRRRRRRAANASTAEGGNAEGSTAPPDAESSNTPALASSAPTA